MSTITTPALPTRVLPTHVSSKPAFAELKIFHTSGSRPQFVTTGADGSVCVRADIGSDPIVAFGSSENELEDGVGVTGIAARDSVIALSDEEHFVKVGSTPRTSLSIILYVCTSIYLTLPPSQPRLVADQGRIVFCTALERVTDAHAVFPPGPCAVLLALRFPLGCGW